MPPQTRSKLQIQPLYLMGSCSPSSGDSYDDSISYLYSKKDTEDWDPRFGAPIRPLIAKRKCVSVSVQTSPIEEVCPPLYRDTGSSSSSPDPESDGDDNYASKRGLKRTQSNTGNQAAKKAKLAKSSASLTKAATPKQPRRDTIITLDGPKPRSIYAPSPTPLQCTYVYPLALGPPRRSGDLRRNKGAKAMPDAQVAPANTTGPQAADGSDLAAAATNPVSAEGAQMEVEDSHKLTHRCPITFSREFEMRRHIRTVHIAEEVRAVVEGRLDRKEATVIPDGWDGKTLVSKPTCAGCGTTFSRPDAVRRHQTEVNAKIENGICIECPGPKVHIRRGPRKDIHQPMHLLTPDVSTLPLAPAPVPALAPVPVVATAPVPGALLAPAPILVSASPTHTVAPASTPTVASAADAAPTPSTESQPQPIWRGFDEAAEGELESEDDM